MYRGMEFVRAHGFVVLVRRPGFDLTGGSLDREPGADTDEIPVAPVPEIDTDLNYSVGALMAPIFDAQGKVSFCLLLAGFHAHMSGEQVMFAGNRLRAACDRISAFVAGRDSERSQALDAA